VGFEKFVTAIRDAALIITDRLHVAVFGHLLGKRVIIVFGQEYVTGKLKSVYDFSMSGPNSRTSIYFRDS
jgi:exopolysaccharide biosynthesis predicted pyruvyltransferase EpsI